MKIYIHVSEGERRQHGKDENICKTLPREKGLYNTATRMNGQRSRWRVSEGNGGDSTKMVVEHADIKYDRIALANMVGLGIGRYCGRVAKGREAPRLHAFTQTQDCGSPEAEI